MYAVREGDTLTSIARDWFGDGSKWDLIVAATPSLTNPNKLRIGQTLRLPPKDARRQSAQTTGNGERTHTVLTNETLSSIAERYYRDATLWTRIYEANERTIGDDPDLLEVGMRLTIPAR